MQKFVFWSIISIGSAVGSWIPNLWHASMFSLWGIAGGLLGCLGGFWLARMLDNYTDI